MHLAFQDFEQWEIREDPIFHPYTVEQKRIYHLGEGGILDEIPRWGEALALKDPAWKEETGIMQSRVKSVHSREHTASRVYIITINWYQIRRYSGSGTDSPQELNTSREGVDGGNRLDYHRYFASTSAGGHGVTKGTDYPGDAFDSGGSRVLNRSTDNLKTLPGLYFHDLIYLGFEGYL